MSNFKQRPILVIGGMGPQASVEVHARLVSKASHRLGLQPPEIIVLSLPIPDFISDMENIETAFNIIVEEAGKASVFEPCITMIACNTAHLLFGRLQKALPDLNLVSLIDAVIRDVQDGNIGKIGLLASPTTIETKLYQDAFERAGIACKLPNKNVTAMLEVMIRDVIGGSSTIHKKALDEMIDKLMSDGCDGVLLGCTELPIIFGHETRQNVFDSIEILCQRMLLEHAKSDIMKET